MATYTRFQCPTRNSECFAINVVALPFSSETQTESARRLAGIGLEGKEYPFACFFVEVPH